jgi:hypothetical protein
MFLGVLPGDTALTILTHELGGDRVTGGIEDQARRSLSMTGGTISWTCSSFRSLTVAQPFRSENGMIAEMR